MKVTRGDGLIEGFERIKQTIRDEFYSVAFQETLNDSRGNPGGL
jgi:hypothetical protein